MAEYSCDWGHGGERAIATELLLLLLIANGTPVLLRKLLDARLAAPVDGGLSLGDGRRLLGPSKTWRGLLAGTAAAEGVGWLLGLDPGQGAATGSLSLSGDLLSSFVKRRMGIPASGRATGLDQIPEALIPTLCLAGWFRLDAIAAVTVVLVFLVLEIVLSLVGFRLGLRRRPY